MLRTIKLLFFVTIFMASISIYTNIPQNARLQYIFIKQREIVFINEAVRERSNQK